ncbi:MAG: N-methyl-L-tryptophan oxidase [Chloroflexi bacterium]|nr:MAG: N-methyl-L-tryptophan oxidase [Chloroflexota bacterium]
MQETWDVVVVGCGGIGSAAAYWLAQAPGVRVLVLERHRIGHPHGASDDHSRIVRLSYHAPEYIALAQAAYDAFAALEEDSGLTLVVKTGGLDLEWIGTEGRRDVSRCAASLQAAGIPYELLDADDVMRRWPQWRLLDGMRALYQADSGLVDARKAVAAHVALARLRGVTVREGSPVLSIRMDGGGYRVETADDVYLAARVIVAADAWTNQVLAGLDVTWPLAVTQEQVTWFATPHIRAFAPERFPVWIWRGNREFYGFPVYGEVATKAGEDVGGDEIDITTRDYQPNMATHTRLLDFLSTYLPDSLGPELGTKTCIYTMPPDRAFILDRLPQHPGVAVAVGAGHAFKFSGLFGRILSDLVLDGTTPYPIDAFRCERPALTDPTFVPTWRHQAAEGRSGAPD